MAKMDEATRKRVRAGRLMLAGKTPAQAAKSVGVARQTAYTWKARLDEGGIDALRAMATGRPAQLDEGQLAALRGALLQGAMAHDFGTELWTLKRVRVLIERLYGVRYAYDSGHMQHHAANFMGLSGADNAALAGDLNATLGNFGFGYRVQQPAAGVEGTAQGYAQFLQRVLRNELRIASLLGTHKVCAQPVAPGCNAAYAPDSIGSEAWNYSLGHWVEDDPVVGDHAFSSAGGGGFYPWIDNSKTWYGIVARERSPGASNFEAAAGYHSAECGRLIRQAWRTGQTVTATTPTPS